VSGEGKDDIAGSYTSGVSRAHSDMGAKTCDLNPHEN